MAENEHENEAPDDAAAIEAANATPDEGRAGDAIDMFGLDSPRADDDEPPEPEQPAFEPPSGMTEKELEANHKKIERARTTFYNRVSEIMGEDSQALVECPACAYFVPGLIFPQEFQDDQKLALWPYMGLPDPNEIPAAPDRHVCETCKGRGQLQSGSLVAQYAIVNCRACEGKGYTDDLLPVRGGAGTNGNLLPDALEPVPPMPEDPAWIEAARAAGYTIVPPMQPVNG
jgi:hypothetical protein